MATSTFTIVFLLSCMCQEIFGKVLSAASVCSQYGDHAVWHDVHQDTEAVLRDYSPIPILYNNLITTKKFDYFHCGDCMPIGNCPEAVRLVSMDKSSECQTLVVKAFCGTRYRRGRKVIQVCCSDFKKYEIKPPANSIEGIESHPNVNLLPSACEDLDNKRISNSKIPAIHELPFMALLSYYTGSTLQFMCGGSIINSKYVLTAAHCIKRHRMAGVRVGEFDIRYNTDCDADLVCESHIQDISIDEFIVHESYTDLKNDLMNDIALLRLLTEIDFSYRNVAPLCLPLAQELRTPLIDGEMGVVAGWGMTEADEPSPLLRKVMIPILTNVTCLAHYNRKDVHGHEYKLLKEFCAGELKKDSCGGDSGGPFVMERFYNYTTSYFQYGIVSRGPRQCGSNDPGIYTNVMDHMGWILDNIRP